MSAGISGPNVVDICICLSSYNDNYYFYYTLKKGYVTTIYHYQIISVNFKLNVTLKKKTHTTHREVKYPFLQQNTSKQANPPSKKKKYTTIFS